MVGVNLPRLVVVLSRRGASDMQFTQEGLDAALESCDLDLRAQAVVFRYLRSSPVMTPSGLGVHIVTSSYSDGDGDGDDGGVYRWVIATDGYDVPDGMLYSVTYSGSDGLFYIGVYREVISVLDDDGSYYPVCMAPDGVSGDDSGLSDGGGMDGALGTIGDVMDSVLPNGIPVAR